MQIAPRSVAVVIPALNEERFLAATLANVREQEGLEEVLVVDGGSYDRTVSVALEAGARVIRSGRGRAVQMNAGAAASGADAVLFLHADTCLPAGALSLVIQALSQNGVVGGCFRLEFDRSSLVYRLYTARFWMRWTRLAFGDRAIFCSRSAFKAIGGFPEQPLFEDLDFVARLSRVGRFHFLKSTVTTSSRRFAENGPLRQQLRNVVLWGAWNAGIPAHRLARFYRYD